MKLTTTLFATAFLLIIANPVFAQPYSFTKSTQAYAEIGPGTPFLQSPKFSDTISLGFNFKIAGVTSNKLYVFIRGSIAALGSPSMGPVFETFSTEHSQGTYSYIITGTAGNRIAKLQFKNIKFDHDFTSSDFANYQVWLYEADNTIELHFGTSSVNSPAESYYYNLGGPAIGTKGFWLKGAAALPATDTAMGTRVAGTPPNGMVYRITNGTTGIAQITAQQKLTIYPVPATNTLHIDGASNTTHYSIYTPTGNLVTEKAVYNNGIDIHALPAGNYMLQVETKGNTQLLKFTKE